MAEPSTKLVTFKKDIHIVDLEEGIDRYFNFDDTVEVTDAELDLVDKYAKRWKIEGKIYVAGAQDLKKAYVAPRVDSPSNPDYKGPDNGQGAGAAANSNA